jgi:benzoyl-CoA 2,3-dioxygenase component A
MSTAPTGGYARQHLIDPEVCIRCNTCESTCPTGAITHDSRNYVVRFEACDACGLCIAPCPTGAIDHWRNVRTSTPYTVDEQYGWDALPAATDLDVTGETEVPHDVRALTEIATAGQGGPTSAPWSAATPSVNLYSIAHPAIAIVAGNYRLTAESASADVRHIVLDFGTTAFPVLEGQTIGILPPGAQADGTPHTVRLYSVASPREGERPQHNNVALTIKRVTEDHDGVSTRGVGSNYMCDLAIGDEVKVVGPYGASFLMPNHPGSSIMMICTGTGSAPMRAMTERRRRRIGQKEGGNLLLFFGARRPDELPYFGPLMKLPKDFIDINLAFSREGGQAKTYVQDLIRARGDDVAAWLQDDECFVYLCGLKGMEHGVLAAFHDVCAARGIDWDALKPRLLAKSRLHIETY